eukprot:752661-Hanusia_phi.AAC.5
MGAKTDEEWRRESGRDMLEVKEIKLNKHKPAAPNFSQRSKICLESFCNLGGKRDGTESAW